MKVSEGHIVVGALIAFSAWLFIGLPWITTPSERIQYYENTQATPKQAAANPDGSARRPFFVEVIPTPKTAQERSEEAKDKKEKSDSDRWLVRWTMALFFATVGLIAATGVLGCLAYMDISESRRIGQAQVRAYVSIRSAQLKFEGAWLEGDLFPRLMIIAINTGQSPARNFIWYPEIEYIGDNQRRRRDMGGNWISPPGASIAAGHQFQEEVLISDMSVIRFKNSVSPPLKHVLVRIRVKFKYIDVFEVEWNDEIFFAGLAVPANDPNAPNMWIISTLSPEAHFRDWNKSDGHFKDQ